MARRHKDDEPAPLTEEEIETRLSAILALKTELDKKTEERQAANGEYRAAIKDAKKVGMDPDAITDALKLRRQDQDEVRLRMRNTGIYLRILGVPIGTQFGLFDQPFANSTAQEAANISTPADGTDEAAKATAYHQGEKAGQTGKNRGDNPYNPKVQFVQHQQWNQGWDDAQTAMTKQMAAAAGKSGDAAPKPKRGRGRPKKANGNGQSETVEALADAGKVVDAPLTAVNQNGVQAGYAGQPKDNNPHSPRTQEHEYWNAGWVNGDKQRKAEAKGAAGHA